MTFVPMIRMRFVLIILTNHYVGYTSLSALELAVDVYVKIWDSYLCGRYEHILDVIREMYARNKISRSVIDARIKNIMDFFVTIQADPNYDDPLGLGTGQGGATGDRRMLKEGSASTVGSRPNSADRKSRGESRKTSVVSVPRPMTQDSGSRPVPLTRGLRPPVPSQVLADYSCTNSHLYLFGKLIGVQPRVMDAAKPAVAYIAVMVMVMAVCEK